MSVLGRLFLLLCILIAAPLSLAGLYLLFTDGPSWTQWWCGISGCIIYAVGHWVCYGNVDGIINFFRPGS